MPIIGTNNIIQKQVLQTAVHHSYSGGTSFTELSSDYRVSITPKFQNSLIFLEYFIPLNQYTSGANNIFGFSGYRYAPSQAGLDSRGQGLGNRKQFAGGNCRAQNGYDVNDHNIECFIAYDAPNTTSACSYGFQMYQEGSDAGTIYVAHSNGNNSTWGMSSRVIITATEIKQ